MTISKETVKKDFERKLCSMYATSVENSSMLQKYNAIGSVLRDYISTDWKKSREQYASSGAKKVYYFSMEFLTGKFLDTNLINSGLKNQVTDALSELGIDIEDLRKTELEQGLGNGGLGRLAACFMDSLSADMIPAMGMGIRYRYGLFRQKIVDGYQIEQSDDWLKNKNVWEVRREDDAVKVKFGGRVNVWSENGGYKINFTDYDEVLAVPYDTPITGYDNHNVNTLRLWKAEVIDDDTFDYRTFASGNYMKAIEKRSNTEFISYALYPDDSNENGKCMRIRQEYFLVSAGCQSIIREHIANGLPINKLHEYVAIQINDTHPAMAVPELMRILMDDYNMGWDEAWQITTKTTSYTNHTIMSEALEKWDVSYISRIIPRIYQIIEEIDRRFRDSLKSFYKNDPRKIESMAIMAEGKIRMAHLAIVGGHSVNGVAWLHTEILKNKELKDFYELYPEKFNNKTNGITHRRWLISSNPALAELITEKIGNGWIKDTRQLEKLLEYKEDTDFLQKLWEIKQKNKKRLCEYIKTSSGIDISPDAVFNVQVKRMHGYKRQLLSILYVIYLYNRLSANPDLDICPKVFIYGAKAYPSYKLAKEVIKLINSVADKINNDDKIKGKLKVVFLENYCVDLAEKIIPAADVSLQISTASKEASGTGNMKLMMNGAITLATLDGANVEIHRLVGDDNMVIFGMTSDQVINRSQSYNANRIAEQTPGLKNAINQIQNGFFGVPNAEFFEVIKDITVNNDPFCVLGDFEAFVKAEERMDEMYKNPLSWRKSMLVNIAKSGVFSSDNTIRSYAEEIWHTPPFEVKG